jgi:hypothetical protein
VKEPARFNPNEIIAPGETDIIDRQAQIVDV